LIGCKCCNLIIASSEFIILLHKYFLPSVPPIYRYGTLNLGMIKK
jgi:hypothetical protein